MSDSDPDAGTSAPNGATTESGETPVQAVNAVQSGDETRTGVTDQPRLVVVCGLPGVGKSTVAEHLGKRLDASVVRSDAVRKSLFPDPEYTDEESRAVYAALYDRAASQLADGASVVLDATFRKQPKRAAAVEVAVDADVPVHLVKVECDHDVARERIERRDGLSDAGVETFRELRDEFDPIEREHVTVDNSGSEDETVAQVERLF